MAKSFCSHDDSTTRVTEHLFIGSEAFIGVIMVPIQFSSGTFLVCWHGIGQHPALEAPFFCVEHIETVMDILVPRDRSCGSLYHTGYLIAFIPRKRR